LNLVTEKLCDVDDFLRERLNSAADSKPNS
jgi:hypothetical protein